MVYFQKYEIFTGSIAKYHYKPFDIPIYLQRRQERPVSIFFLSSLYLQAPYNQVTYSIISGQDGGNFFSISSQTGDIFLQNSIFNDPASSYRVHQELI